MNPAPERLPRGARMMLTQRQVIDAWHDELDRVGEAAETAERNRLGIPWLQREVDRPAWAEALALRGGRQAADSWTCPECGAHFEAPPAGSFYPQRVKCVCVDKAVWAARLAYNAAHLPAAAAELWSYVEVPERYRQYTLDAFERRKGTSTGLRACREWLGEEKLSGGVVLLGNVGSGKTHLAVATARASIEGEPHTVEFVSASDLIERHRASGFDGAVLERYASTDLLILDDLGQHRVTDYSRDTIYHVLDARYTADRATIVTSNLDAIELGNLYGPALISRLRDTCTFAALTASDYRLERAKARSA